MFESLNCYLVGGAVRDELLGKTVHDRDWVVVGSCVEEMVSLRFVQVGKDFPVFLHPDSHEEYALARTERKQGVGHTGFVVNADPAVTLEEDLKRRDLTVNAIAKSADGSLIDPFNGQQDIENKCLRHVSAAFAEDPLRVFRVARFAAQLPDFTVAPATLEVMSEMAGAGELQHLSAERVWVEFEKALATPQPRQFIKVLRDCQALDQWFLELNDTPAQFSSGSSVDRFAQLLLSPQKVSALCKRLKCPGWFQQVSLDHSLYGETLEKWRGVRIEQLLEAFLELRVNHGMKRFDAVVQVSRSFRTIDTELESYAKAFGNLRLTKDPQLVELQGKAFGEKLKRMQIQWLTVHRAR